MRVHRINAVMDMTGLPRPTIYLYMKKNMFPKPIKLGARSVGWLEEELLAWIASKQKKRA